MMPVGSGAAAPALGGGGGGGAVLHHRIIALQELLRTLLNFGWVAWVAFDFLFAVQILKNIENSHCVRSLRSIGWLLSYIRLRKSISRHPTVRRFVHVSSRHDPFSPLATAITIFGSTLFSAYRDDNK